MLLGNSSRYHHNQYCCIYCNYYSYSLTRLELPIASLNRVDDYVYYKFPLCARIGTSRILYCNVHSRAAR